MLDSKVLEDYFIENDKTNGINTVLLDSYGNMLLGERPENLEVIIKNITHKRDYSVKSFPVSIGNKEWYLNFAFTNLDEWTLCYMTQLSEFRNIINGFKNKIMISLGFLLLALCGITYWNSKRSYLPFTNLALQMQTIVGDRGLYKSATDEDYIILKNGIQVLTERIQQLDNSMRQHKDVIKAEYLRQWILRGVMTEYMKEYIGKNTSLLTCDRIRLIITRIDAYGRFADMNDFSSRRVWKNAMGNICEELINNIGTTTEMVDFGTDHICLIATSTGYEQKDIINALDGSRSRIERLFGFKVTMAVSDPMDINENIRKVYEATYELTTLKFITGEDKVFEISDFDKYNCIMKPLPDGPILGELIESVNLGRKDRVNAILRKISDHMKQLGYYECIFQLTYVIYTVFKSFNRMNILQNINGIQNLLKKFHTNDEVYEWLENELLKLIESANSQDPLNKKGKILVEIVEYIKHHINDPMLSVDSIAEYVSLSPQYMRIIFKEGMRTSIINYIINERIIKAKELLRETDLNVVEIGERCGFNTKSNFFATFKRETGMTPSQYRMEPVV